MTKMQQLIEEYGDWLLRNCATMSMERCARHMGTSHSTVDRMLKKLNSRPKSDMIPGCDPVMRSGVTCKDCVRCPCFRGMEVISSNLAQTCHDFCPKLPVWLN